MKIIFCCLALLILSTQAMAAPYDLDSPPESYTWGESQEVVKSMLPGAQVVGKDRMFLRPDQGNYALIFTFWKNQLVSINRSTGQIDDMTAAQAQYQELKEKLSAQWGTPAAPAPCESDGADCTMVTWQSTHATTPRLTMVVREMPGGQKTFISLSYDSSQLFPEFTR